jgi:hypothetical protein
MSDSHMESFQKDPLSVHSDSVMVKVVPAGNVPRSRQVKARTREVKADASGTGSGSLLLPSSRVRVQ